MSTSGTEVRIKIMKTEMDFDDPQSTRVIVEFFFPDCSEKEAHAVARRLINEITSGPKQYSGWCPND